MVTETFLKEVIIMDKTLLMQLIEREKVYFDSLKPDDEEYAKSQTRLMKLNSQLTDLEKTEVELEKSKEELELSKETSKKENKDRFIKNIMEGVKIGSGIILPIVGLVGITAVEKEITFTGALREYTRYFLPKKQ